MKLRRRKKCESELKNKINQCLVLVDVICWDLVVFMAYGVDRWYMYMELGDELELGMFDCDVDIGSSLRFPDF
jgi:hypothetical protein